MSHKATLDHGLNCLLLIQLYFRHISNKMPDGLVSVLVRSYGVRILWVNRVVSQKKLDYHIHPNYRTVRLSFILFVFILFYLFFYLFIYLVIYFFFVKSLEKSLLRHPPNTDTL